ncbi:TetR/AcrR family transcriptional regulator C-terminal domain-containing protein [Frankia sp. R82]|uniref:TetR/AcrR family transcriptional regulator C-terminal domain-containing protein n=1 Tax=Frankia sp. R82 TaxID=2950553 RepID=UPI002043E33B|nr:TetR/AcrR family transcriptional regulator C-terminal domain-containing protein [Frankia sp. R82]MCM3884578.1 TetR/AcrR family transcriptional regulator C-terminal domain-containing protein [Frankia sp. R82]
MPARCWPASFTTGQTLADTAAATPEGQPTRRDRVRALAGADQFPHLATVLDAATHNQEARFTLGLRTLLAGLDQQRAAQTGG